MSPNCNAVLLIDHETGRAHALCDLFLRTDPSVTIYYGPGHAAVRHPRIVQVPSISLTKVETVIDFCRQTKIDFVLVSWINSLAIGYVDTLLGHGLRVIGPSQRGAELESSKRRGKQFCAAQGIRIPRHRAFDDPDAASAYINSLPYQVVVKEDGLTDMGDGVHVCTTAAEAQQAVNAIADRTGDAFSVVVEERLRGIDISLLALTDGIGYVMFPAALDYKRCSDGNRGKNCDGMGSIAPHPAVTPQIYAEAAGIFSKVIAGLKSEQVPYTGFLFVGAMITDEGLRVLEINSRFGDSEAQVILPSVQSNFTELCRRVLERRLDGCRIEIDSLVRCCVIATQGNIAPRNANSKPGWPFGDYEVGQRIEGLEEIDPSKALVFFAGTGIDRDGRLVTSRGRVLHVVGYGKSAPVAIDNAYSQISRISFPGIRYRSDIGQLVALHEPQDREPRVRSAAAH
jgi:phosphoribosylamine--glycine ligase